jgi:dipicolinate synthase subunit B
MTTEKKGCIAFAVCGSFCTLEAALSAAQALTRQGWELLPVMSFSAGQDTRFGTGKYWKERLEALAGHPVLDTLQAVEPLGPRQMARALVIAPCTGATLARLAAGLSDTPVTLAAKSLLRTGKPVLLGVSTNDGLGASGENIARLYQRKHIYFVPYGQDDPVHKPNSLKADFTLLPDALAAALHGQQLQPVLLGQRECAISFQSGQNVVY